MFLSDYNFNHFSRQLRPDQCDTCLINDESKMLKEEEKYLKLTRRKKWLPLCTPRVLDFRADAVSPHQQSRPRYHRAIVDAIAVVGRKEFPTSLLSHQLKHCLKAMIACGIEYVGFFRMSIVVYVKKNNLIMYLMILKYIFLV